MPRARPAGLVAVICLVLAACTADTSSSSTTPPTTVGTTSTTEAPTYAVSGTPEDGYDAVQQEVARLQGEWSELQRQPHAYRTTIECECPEAGRGWFRWFGSDLEDENIVAGPASMGGILGRARSEIEAGEREVSIEVVRNESLSFSVSVPEDDWRATVDGSHMMDPAGARELAGTWLFAGGALGGEDFRSPPRYGAIRMSIYGQGRVTYPLDCNEVGAVVDVTRPWFGVGLGAMTLVGCDASREAAQFDEALRDTETFRFDGSTLVLTGPASTLRFVEPPEIEMAGALERTFAGGSIEVPVPAGPRHNEYLLTADTQDPLRGVRFVLYPGRDENNPSWTVWDGEFEASIDDVSGPEVVVIPPDVEDGDFALCTPYWEPDPICWNLLVRPPSAPWFVTAGPFGVVLHDADGTSERVWQEPADIAFLIGRTLVVGGNGEVTIVSSEGERSLPVPGDLVDVAADEVLVVAIDTGDTIEVMSADGDTLLSLDAADARFVGVDLLVTDDGVVTRLGLDGRELWSMSVETVGVAAPFGPDVVRVDGWHTLNTENGVPYLQYLSVLELDAATGATIDRMDMEIAIPDPGHEVAEPCTRAEYLADLMLCSTPDGRVVAVRLDGGDTRAVEGASGVATFVRPGPG